MAKVENAIALEEDEYGFIKIIVVIGLFILGSILLIVICDIMFGKPWKEAIPCVRYFLKVLCFMKEYVERRARNSAYTDRT